MDTGKHWKILNTEITEDTERINEILNHRWTQSVAIATRVNIENIAESGATRFCGSLP